MLPTAQARRRAVLLLGSCAVLAVLASSSVALGSVCAVSALRRLMVEAR
jgi:hypothetical protein